MAIISSGVAFIDRNHHETALRRVDIFRRTIFHLVAARSTTQNAGHQTARVASREKKKRSMWTHCSSGEERREARKDKKIY
jgi:hypothetical protein